MFADSVYIGRRQALREKLRSGVALLLGNVDSPINFAHNVHPFRQDSTFSYFFGLSRPGLAAIIDVDRGEDVVFGDDPGLDDEIWLGESTTLANQCAAVGCSLVKPYGRLQEVIGEAIRRERDVHFLPPYRAETTLDLSRLLGHQTGDIGTRASPDLIRAVVGLREIKSEMEIAEIESALSIADEMHRTAMRLTRPGVLEREVAAGMRQVLGRHGVHEAYRPVFTKRGEILHNFNYNLRLERGDLVVNDSGAVSALGYASDITRTLPVGGQFDLRQRELYELLLQVQTAAIEAIRPGMPFVDVHRLAALRMVEGMTALGFFRGNPLEVVSSGAYAICFPHGLGHQLGLDVHDMESFGEDQVGYDEQFHRSPLFGMSSLRMARCLKPGMVLTVEPGIYFIPALIRRWSAERRHGQFIDYDRFNKYLDFGGMRVEDEVLVTAGGSRVMGPGTPKTVAEVEGLLAV
ncbi:Xaa-Pro aminopeptidase [Paraburkholderia domus]|jgi:Xaa-Pro aminopeptidase|uniref:aminopeptidase P family protein n=1 Tax=Paraburkholderia domus TaxID=2793075 RepID=UPI001912AF6D|nr:aminopeptidase P family protein [Paraburkholderia domus]MBK5051675.1 aminopeptidase P N-terminal domain-containing protein [Burkholderia sp. R-70006]MCI0151647.1 aminopeptidase P N-terminal domain-containing protein [Paraburkholderia sediminicola]CAE6789767.1 Xaa-Pro aminopeptidase [Paraburkholderia domus]CAE6793764.1 Xaa-Pro aminopeptidase [Paraburkholderia domus]